jgi:hypothetical protein
MTALSMQTAVMLKLNVRADGSHSRARRYLRPWISERPAACEKAVAQELGERAGRGDA